MSLGVETRPPRGKRHVKKKERWKKGEKWEEVKKKKKSRKGAAESEGVANKRTKRRRALVYVCRGAVGAALGPHGRVVQVIDFGTQ